MAAPRDWRDDVVRLVRCRLSISMRLLSFFVSGFVVAFVILTDAFFLVFDYIARSLSLARARARFSISDSDSLAQSFALLRVFPRVALFAGTPPATGKKSTSKTPRTLRTTSTERRKKPPGRNRNI